MRPSTLLLVAGGSALAACLLSACGAGGAGSPAVAPIVLPQEANLAVANVPSQLLNLRHQGEWLAAHPQSGQSITGSGEKHYQGIVRANYKPGGPNDVLYVTKSGHPDNNEEAFLGVIQLRSRSSTAGASAPYGERMRSNLLQRGVETADTEPPTSDRVVKRIEFDDWKHPGGLQMIGDILVVPMEQPIDANGETIEDKDCEIWFYDCTDRLNPVRMDYSLVMDIDTGLAYKPRAEAGVVGIIKLPEPDGRFALLVTWAGDYQVACYISNRTSFFLPDGSQDPLFEFQLYDLWEIPDQRDFDFTSLSINPFTVDPFVGPWPYATNSSDNNLISTFQTMHLVQQADGRIYMIAALNTNNFSPVFVGYDVVSLFEVQGLPNDGVRTVGDIRFEFAGRKAFNMMPHDEGVVILGGEIGDRAVFGNGNAGVGAYVSPTGELLLYAIAHNETDENIDLLRMSEFRHRDMTWSEPHVGPRWMPEPFGPQVTLEVGQRLVRELRAEPWILGSWADLYEDISYNSNGNAYNKICQVIDAPDLLLDDYETQFSRLDGAGINNGFEDKASSHRLCVDPTTWLALYNDNNLEDNLFVVAPDADGGFSLRSNYGFFDANDQANSATFRTFQETLDSLPADTGMAILAGLTGLSAEEIEARLAVPEVEWDLDGDGVFEIVGTAKDTVQKLDFVAEETGIYRIRARRRGVGTDVQGNTVELVIRVVARGAGGDGGDGGSGGT